MTDPVHKEAFLVAIFVQSILYGVYVATLLHCLGWLLFTKEGWRKVNWPMLVIPMNLFALETTGLGLNFARIFVYLTGSRSQDFVQLGSANAALKHSTFLFVDLVLIFRCWVLYAQNWRVVCLPLLLWLSCLVCPFFNTNCYVPDLSFGQSQQSIWGFLLPPSVVLFFGCHIASNIYATSAIIYRIVQATPEKRKTCGHTTRRVLAESGLLYTLSSVLSLIAHAGAAINNSPFAPFHTTLDAINFCMAGISINLIFIGSWQAAEVLELPLPNY
ncbi:hypothetical protein JOM56_001636 [Amanita muscaria]